jgi:hypothetical protein
MKLVGCMARSKECQVGQGARIGAGVNCSKKMWENPYGDGSKPYAPVVHIKIAGIYGCE